MFGKLTVRAIIPVTIAVTGFVVVSCIILFNFMKKDSIRDAVHHETSLADTVVKAAHYSMLHNDPAAIRSLIDNVGAQPGIVHVRIFNKKGIISYSHDQSEVNRVVDKREAGCIGCHAGATPSSSLGRMEQARQFSNHAGVPVIAITVPIYNDPSCFTAACHIHAAGQKVLGTLDIGVSAEPLRESLRTMRWRMAIFSLMVLCLTVSGVAAMLRRAIFLPVQRLVAYVQHEPPAEESALPHLHGEFGLLLQHIRQLEHRARQAEEQLEPSAAGREDRTDPGTTVADPPQR